MCLHRQFKDFKHCARCALRCETSITCSRSSQETVHSAYRFIQPSENSKTELLFKKHKSVLKRSTTKGLAETVHWGDPKKLLFTMLTEQPWNWKFGADAWKNACRLGSVVVEVDGCWTFTESERFSSGGRGTTGQLWGISTKSASLICWSWWGVLKFSPPTKLLRIDDIFSFCWNDGLALYDSMLVSDLWPVIHLMCRASTFASDKIVTEVALTQWLLSGGLISALRDIVRIMVLR